MPGILLMDNGHAGVSSIFVADSSRTIRATVVDKQQFPVAVALSEDSIEARTQETLAIVNGNDDG